MKNFKQNGDTQDMHQTIAVVNFKLREMTITRNMYMPQ